MLPELITGTRSRIATGHILHVSFSRLLTQFKMTSSAPLLVLHLPCKTHSLHIIGRLDTRGAFRDWAWDVFDAVSLTWSTLPLICEAPHHPVMVIGIPGLSIRGCLSINCLASDDFSLGHIQPAASAVWRAVPHCITEERNGKLSRFSNCPLNSHH